MVVLCSMAQNAQQPTANYRVIPLPQQINMVMNKGFVLNERTSIIYPANNLILKSYAKLLALYIKQLTGIQLKISTFTTDAHNIELSTGMQHPNKEAYHIMVSPEKITIEGATEAGTFYGIQTLRKAIPLGKLSKIIFPAGEIIDYPQFGYRGAMLDVARHFFGVDAIKQFIDMLALHNINYFHWHLTDDQGWRIEIKKYPLLVEKGSMRAETAIGHTDKKDGTPYGGYYTQAQIKEIVQYAAQRHIEIVPEIDMPGHMVAALTAYPKLGCKGGPYSIRTEWGIADDVLCAGNDSTLQFAKDVMNEVMALFPGKYICIGGDECSKAIWKQCKKCQTKIQQLGMVTDNKYTKEQKLQSYFMSAVAHYITSKGRKVCGWDEILEGDGAPGATILSWRGIGGAEEAARLGRDAIMCPTSHMYFDYYQTENRSTEPVAFNAYLPIQRVYSFQPVPTSLTPQQAKHIMGVQANLWTEQIKTLSHVQYMMLPRLAAACEVQWCDSTQKDENDFMFRLPHLLQIYQKLGYNYAHHYFTVASNCTPAASGKYIKVALSCIKQAQIYYTTDGTLPNKHCQLYKKPFKLKHSAIIRAVAYIDSLMSDPLNDTVVVHKALMKSVKYLTLPNSSYQGNSILELVNGQLGNTFFHSGKWVGFVNNDMDVIIDLKKQQTIHSVAIRTLTEQSNWIFPDRGVTLSISTDVTHFTTAYTDHKPALPHMVPASVNTQTILLQNAKARYLRVQVLSERNMPQWHYGHGNTAFLFVDEIVVK